MTQEQLDKRLRVVEEALAEMKGAIRMLKWMIAIGAGNLLALGGIILEVLRR